MNSPPTLTTQVNFQTSGPPPAAPPWMPIVPGLGFENFGSVITQTTTAARPLPVGVPPIVPGGPFYYFEGNWSTAGLIPYCTWMHFGLEFEETGHNYGYWLQGTWTKNGVDPPGIPIYGFNVPSDERTIRIQNASGVSTKVTAIDLMVLQPHESAQMPLANLNTYFFETHSDWNNRWVHVPGITEQNPLVLDSSGPAENRVSSFFDVYFDTAGLPPLQPGQVLLARQHSTYLESTGDPEFWQYEVHGAVPEPGTLSLLAVGGLLLAIYAVRRCRRAS